MLRSVTGVIAAAVLLAVLALPAAAGGPVKLSHPSVTPPSGTTATTFVLTVTYRNRKGAPPDYVRVVIGDRAYRMVATGSDWRRGVEFTFRTKLAPGDHDVAYLTGSPAARTEIAGPTIHVKRAPRPEPTPDRGSDGGPKPKPDRKPPITAPKPPATIPKPAGSPDASPAGAPDPHPTPDSTPDVAVPAGPPSDPGSSGDGTTAGVPGSWGDLTRYLEALGLDPMSSPYVRLVPVMIWTTGGVALFMAFGFFGKRRRDGEPPEPDEVLEAKAARGMGEAATAALVPEPEPAPALVPVDAEMAMPRWRRPSLLEARKADPLRSGTRPPRLSFDHASVAPIDGLERRLIRYLVVHLLDTPDEFRGAEIGSLAQGDEVQLLERSGTYWLVLCPDGQEGWIHRMTLGDVVGGPAAPSARETWATTSIEVEAVDDDVLTAFMTARGRA